MFIKELLTHWTYQVFAPGAMLRSKYEAFKSLLALDERCLELISELEAIHYGNRAVDWGRVVQLCRRIEKTGRGLVKRLIQISPTRYMALSDYFEKAAFYMNMALDMGDPDLSPPYVVDLAQGEGQPLRVGGKAAALARVAREKEFRTPPGLVVTASAFNYLLEYNGIRPTIDRLLSELSLEDPETLENHAMEIREHILSAELPAPLAEDITDGVKELAGRCADMDGVGDTFSVRSSAVAEDGERSYAGQYDSLLNVPLDGIPRAYLQVLAGKYSTRAIIYRILNGVADVESPMAVLVQPMVEAAQAGVVYSRDMDRSQVIGGIITIYAVDGLGEELVSGRKQPSIISMDRGGRPDTLLESQGTGHLEHQAAFTLARQAQYLEAMFGCPQDIEWALDAEGHIWILQSRPMQDGKTDSAREEADPTLKGQPFVEGGATVSGGRALGTTVRAATTEELDRVPDKGLLLTPTLSPNLVRAMNRLSGVVAATGSRAGHFASVAREFGLPVMVLGRSAFATIPEGEEVFLDADRGELYHGSDVTLPGERRHGPIRTLNLASATRLAKVMPHVASLNLLDPQADNFRPEGCRSVHDVVRFAHEKALEEMFSLVGRNGRGLAQSVRVKTGLPIALYALDLGGGLFESARDKKEITPEDITSTPMWTVWWGLTQEKARWSDDTLHVDWEEFDRISAGIFRHDSRLLASYAILSDDYLHLLVRFGYHFAVLDTLCGSNPEKNHIRFRFKGGGGNVEQRMLRLSFIRTILDRFGFDLATTGDMLDASIARIDETATLRHLAVIGRLLAVTRLMDISLDGDDSVASEVDGFLARLKHPGEDGGGRGTTSGDGA